jgi:hypothetical protein
MCSADQQRCFSGGTGCHGQNWSPTVIYAKGALLPAHDVGFDFVEIQLPNIGGKPTRIFIT